jgi:hypothetical protein
MGTDGQNVLNIAQHTPTIISREDARALGRVWYYTGRPCRRDHLAMRYVSTGHCASCLHTGPAVRDGRRVPKVIRLTYAAGASFDDRRRAAEYIDACLASLNASMGYTVLSVMVNKKV